MATKPKGVIDDIFRQAGYKTINEVRNLVRHAIAAESKAQVKALKAAKTKTRVDKLVQDTIESGAKRVKTPKKANPKKSQQNRITAAQKEYVHVLNKQIKTSKTKTKAIQATERHTALMSNARSKFPSEAAFRKALAEERRNIQKIKGKVK